MPDPIPSIPYGRILAMDVGKKRIGLAISDALGISAQGLPTFQRGRVRDDFRLLAALIEEREVAQLLIGKPLHMSGDESRQSGYTREFAARLQLDTGVPVVFWDERLTTVEAERVLREAGATLDQRKKAVDRMSAVLLLESYLESRLIRKAFDESHGEEGSGDDFTRTSYEE